MKHPIRSGFTLVELLLVVFILAAVAASATSLVGQAEEQFRYDDTKARREEVRRAILGDPSRTANGQPVVSGFVADTGRLPGSLAELLLASVAWESSGAQSAGLRGPYLRAGTEGPLARSVYRDGWSNPDRLPDDPDFGWMLTSGAELTLWSLGSNGQPGPPPLGELDYAWDTPPESPASARTLVSRDDYLARAEGWFLRLRNRTGAGLGSGTVVRLRVVHPQVPPGGGPPAWLTLDSLPITLPAALADGEVSQPLAVPFDPDGPRVPWGRRSAVVVDDPATPADRRAIGREVPLTLLPGVAPPELALEVTTPP